MYSIIPDNCDIFQCNTTPHAVHACYTFVPIYTYSCSGATDEDGVTLLDIATQKGITKIADYLKSLPQQCKLTSTQCGPIQLYVLSL